MGDGRVFLDTRDDMALEVGVATCELVRKGGKDLFELSSFEVISGTEEAGTKESISGNRFREGLGYRRFPGACQSVQPKHVLVLGVPRPEHDVLED